MESTSSFTGTLWIFAGVMLHFIVAGMCAGQVNTGRSGEGKRKRGRIGSRSEDEKRMRGRSGSRNEEGKRERGKSGSRNEDDKRKRGRSGSRNVEGGEGGKRNEVFIEEEGGNSGSNSEIKDGGGDGRSEMEDGGGGGNRMSVVEAGGRGDRMSEGEEEGRRRKVGRTEGSSEDGSGGDISKPFEIETALGKEERSKDAANRIDKTEENSNNALKLNNNNDNNNTNNIGPAAPSSSPSSSSSSSSSSFQRSPLDLTLLRDPVFLLVSLAFALANPCVYGVWSYLPSLALEVGLDKGRFHSNFRRMQNFDIHILAITKN